MTTFAATNNVLVDRSLKGRRGKNIGGIVADTAFIQRGNVINRFGGRDAAGVAGRTIVGVYAQMVKLDACKGRELGDTVTARTIEDRRQVIDRFSETDCTFMAGSTVAGVNPQMVKCRTRKACDVMAG